MSAMFSTILDKITGYFDKSTLISAFFPGLIFWGLTLIIVSVLQIGAVATLKGWAGMGISEQILVFIAFVAWVMFWSFLTVNFRTMLMQLYEGYWPQVSLWNVFYRWRLTRWRRHWNDLDAHDRSLEEQELALLNLRDMLNDLRDALDQKERSNQDQQVEIDQAEIEADMMTFVGRLKEHLEQLQSLAGGDISLPATLPESSQKTQEWWTQHAASFLNVAGDSAGYGQLMQAAQELEPLVNQCSRIVQRRRNSLYNKLLTMPPGREDVMPTMLGNVLKAVEVYPATRYHLDAVLIWSRLQPELPAECSDSLQVAKTSFDLMVTLSASFIVFGIPLTLWILVRWSPYLPPWVALITILLAVSLSWISYLNAVQAGVQYGERIKAAFDLYRWKVLQSLHLKLPENFMQEQQLWEAVCGLLARSYPPDASVYCYAQLEQSDPEEHNAQV
jgi:hypothetical protein